jgi:hypothetical protein
MEKEIGGLPKILVMVYTCTFLVFHIVIQQKHYPDLKKEVMSPFANRYRSTNQKKYFTTE